MKKSLTLLICAMLFIAQGAIAGGGHDHGPKNGGVVREVGDVAYELVAKADKLTLYVSNHGKPMVTTGATARIKLFAGNAQTEVVLEPAGDSRMEAKGNFKLGVGVRAALAITLSGQTEQKVTFNLK